MIYPNSTSHAFMDILYKNHLQTRVNIKSKIRDLFPNNNPNSINELIARLSSKKLISKGLFELSTVCKGEDVNIMVECYFLTDKGNKEYLECERKIGNYLNRPDS